MKPAARPPRPRGLFIAALLLLTLALAGAIALQAYRTFLGHKATAERVLRDYARIAAGRFVQRANMNVYYSAFYPIQDALSRAKAGQPEMPLPAPGHLPAGSEHHTADFRTLARYTFRYDLKSGRLETAGETPSAAARRWLLDTLPVHSRTVYEPKERVASIVRSVDGVPRAIVYTVVMDKAGAPRLVLGLEEDPRGFEGLYAAEADRFPLLPRPLTGGVVDDSLGSAVVTGADGVELYRSPVQYAPTFAARDSMEPILGGMRVQIALRPDFAPTLVIGGMPRSNLPMLLSLLALTAGLVVAALLQLARENELARLRADFVSGVSHELRTPLAQIRMFSETLLLGRVRSDGERVRSLEIIDQEARRLTHLVQNLAPLAAARGMIFRVNLSDGVVAPVDADALRQMLVNLLDNAVKYGPADQLITVRLEAAEGKACIRVEDQGPGIPAADRERIWGRFWRLERDRGTAVAGTGIGLSVVRELVALHGGRAWAEDARGGVGACFVIELPLEAQPGVAPSAAELRADLGATA